MPTKLFTRMADLARHRKSIHEKQYIDCPKRLCSRKGINGFTRNDHLVEHLRGYHGESISKRLNTSSHSTEDQVDSTTSKWY